MREKTGFFDRNGGKICTGDLVYSEEHQDFGKVKNIKKQAYICCSEQNLKLADLENTIILPDEEMRWFICLV